MNQSTIELKKVNVSMLPVVTLKKDSTKKDLFHLMSIVPTKEDCKRNEVIKASAEYTNKFSTVKAKNEKIAYNLHTSYLNDTFNVVTNKPAETNEAETNKEEKKSRRGKAETINKKKEAEKKKAELKAKKEAEKKAKEEEAKKKAEAEANKEAKKEKVLATFKHFCETSSVKCLPISKDNANVVKEALKMFDLYNKSLFNKLTEVEEKQLSVKPVDKLMNRNTIRILVTETNKEKKVIAQYLLKPLYMSPYSFLTVVEAHKRDKKQVSAYDDLINSVDSPLTCYDSFQFNPLLESLTTSDIIKTDNTLKYDFCNIVTE